MELILFIQQIANEFWDTIFIFFTLFGEKLFFVVVFSVLYWCISKSFAFKLFLIYIVSAIVNSGIKSIVKAPRPDANVVRVTFYQTATGASFPSGHTQSVALYVSSITNKYGKKNWIAIVCGALLISLVAFSRIYLGVHFIQDVVVGALLGYIIGFFGTMFLKNKTVNARWFLLGIVPAIVLLFFTDSIDVYSSVGAGVALIVGYNLENKFVDLLKPLKVWQFVLRIAVGFIGLTVIVFLTNAMFSTNKFELLCAYFVIGMWVSFLAPAIFKILESKFMMTPKKIEEEYPL